MRDHALVIGKFYPPHAGHHLLIREAAKVATRVTVVVMASRVESIPLADRVSCLAESHALDRTVTVTGIACDAPMDLASRPVWAAQVACMRAAVRQVTGIAVDVVVSSEKYGDELARWFGAVHVPVDPERVQFPISGTGCRADLAGNWEHLDAPAQALLTTRIVVLGAESTGTTTVSHALAQRFRARGGIWRRTHWVPEYGRTATADKLARARVADASAGVDDLVWTGQDFADIARIQNEWEEAAARSGSPLTICDTDAEATTVWERRYLGPDSTRAHDHRPGRHALYLITDHVGVPFVQDGLRDGESIREEMTEWFVDALTAAGRSWVMLTGNRAERLDLASQVTEQALAHRSTFAAPLGG